MPAGESLGNGAVFNAPSAGMMPMPAFDPGMLITGQGGPSPREMEKRIKDEQQKALIKQLIQQRDTAVSQPLNYNRQQAVNLDVNAIEGGIESLGGTAKIQLDPNQRLKFGANYMPAYNEQGLPVEQSYRIEAGYETPGFGVNVNYRPRRSFSGDPAMGGGFGAQMNFNQRF